MAKDPGCTMDVSSLHCCYAQTTLAQEQLYAAKRCLDEESTVEEVLVVSTGYDESLSSTINILLSYPHFGGRHVDRLSLGNRRS